MNETFRKWDQLLQMITENHPRFLTTLTDEMVNQLAFSSESSSMDSSRHDGIFMWLDHILTAPEWEPSRRFLASSYILTVCRENSNSWANSLQTSILRHDAEQRSTRVHSSTIVSGTARTDLTSTTDSDDGAENVEALARFGWTISERWDRTLLGTA